MTTHEDEHSELSTLAGISQFLQSIKYNFFSQNIREVYRLIAAVDSECQTYFRARICPHTHMPSLSAELAALQR